MSPLKEFLQREREQGKEKAYYHLVQKHSLAVERLEKWLGEYFEHLKEDTGSYLEVFDKPDINHWFFTRLKTFESVYTKIFGNYPLKG